jgi:hypothetical protein
MREVLAFTHDVREETMDTWSRHDGCVDPGVPRLMGHRRNAGARLFTWSILVLTGVAALSAAASSGAGAAAAAGGDGSVQSVSGTSTLNSVACTSASSCVAVGSLDGEGVVVPIANGVPGPVQVLSGTDNLTSVTCTKAGSCTAVGTAPYANPPEATVPAGITVGITAGQAFVGPAFTGTGQIGVPDMVYPSGIACSSGAHCVAVGYSTYQAGFGVGLTRRGPDTVQSISPVSLSGVECVSEHLCVAQGQTEGTNPDDTIGVADFLRVGGAQGQIHLGTSVAFANGTDLLAGTCRNESLEFCQMAGVVGGEGAIFSVVGESSGLTRPVAGTSSLNDEACAGDYWCVAVGQTTAGDGAVVPVGWEDPTTLEAVTGVNQFNGVSCPTQGSCIAVGANASTGIIDTFPVWG